MRINYQNKINKTIKNCILLLKQDYMKQKRMFYRNIRKGRMSIVKLSLNSIILIVYNHKILKVFSPNYICLCLQFNTLSLD